MKPLLTTALTITFYALMIWITDRVCSSGKEKKDEFDRVLIPLISLLWPLAWGFIIGQEIVGFFRRKISSFKRARRIKKKAKHHLERLKEMNQ